MLAESPADRQQKVLKLLDTSGMRLHALLGRLTLCEDVVGDLMQELFVRLYQSRGFGKAKDPFAYAYRAAVNLAFEWRKRQKTTIRSLNHDCPAARQKSPLAQMIQAEQLQQLLDATAQLNDLARDVIVMHYIEQEPYDQIAERLGKKPQHLRSVASKAMARLRGLLADRQAKAM
ncbi:MAG: RNA polymerase sigma factor [Planctomycetota bacterium]